MLWSKQGIRRPVSRNHIAGSGLELIEVACFFKLTAIQVLVLGLGIGSIRSQAQTGYYSGGEGGVLTKAKFRREFPWRVVNFSSEMFLAQSSLGKSLIYCVKL